MIRVLVSAQPRLFREALAELLGREDDLAVVGAVAGGGDALAAVRTLEPDVVVIDLDHGGSVEPVRELAGARHSKLIGLVASNNDQDVIAYAEAGLAGFLNHEDSSTDLAETIRSAARGEFQCSPRTAGTLLRHVAELASKSNGYAQHALLTGREREVMLLLDEGLSNKQIAERLHIELATVKHHVHHILEKLEAKRRSQAVARARRAGLFDPGV